ncbi:MAG: DUF2125 domain-containing protein [Alphaproteobacteria bacterium]|nr:DUF2125 domain-containing protein [Alphaproteobacteria bacterium]
MSLTTRFFIYAPFALFVVLASGVSYRWFSQAEALSRRLDALNGHTAMPGVTVSFSSKEISGFPFRIDALFKNFRLRATLPDGVAIEWQSEAFALHRLTYGADTTVMESSGWQRLSLASQHVAFRPGTMRASAVETGQRLRRFDLVIAGLAGSRFCLERAELHFRSRVRAADIDLRLLGDGTCRPAGNVVPPLQISAMLAPEPPLAALESGSASIASGLSALHAQRARLVLQQIEFPLQAQIMSGSGGLDFDLLGRPTGNIQLARVRSTSPSPLSGWLAHTLGGASNAAVRNAELKIGEGAITLGEPRAQETGN